MIAKTARALADQLKVITVSFGSIFSHIFRELNVDADALSKEINFCQELWLWMKSGTEFLSLQFSISGKKSSYDWALMKNFCCCFDFFMISVFTSVTVVGWVERAS